MHLAVNLLDPNSVLKGFGVLGVLVFLFAETGLMIGFFLPGDTLLFTAGFFASTAAVHSGVHLSLPLLMSTAPIVAVCGAQLGHYIGAKAGLALIERPKSRLIGPERLQQAEYYFHRFGPMRSVVFARFIPVVRTFLNPVAGMLEMPAGRFLVANIIGALLWTDGVLLAGYYLGSRIPDIDHYLLPIVGLAVLVSLVSVLREVLHSRKAGRAGGRHAAARREPPMSDHTDR